MSTARLLSRRLSTKPTPFTPASFRPFIERQGSILLDGGIGTALGAESQRHVLWGAQHLFRLDGHNKILDMHRKFLEAGADCISSASYTASFELFSAAGTFTDGTLPGGSITNEKFQHRYTNDVLRASVELAKKARNDFWAVAQSEQPGRLRPLVAASVGPAGDNTTVWSGATDPHRAVHDVPDEVVSLYYRRQCLALSQAMPDLLAIETLPGLREARLALAALTDIAPDLAKHGLVVPPVWLSFICTSDTATAAGDDFGEAAAEVARHAGVHAVGVNCVAPSLIEPLLRRARAACGPETILLAYPNSGEVWDSRQEERCWHAGGQGDEVLDGTHAIRMRRAGADGIGGCCRVGAEQIRVFREALLASE